MVLLRGSHAFLLYITITQNPQLVKAFSVLGMHDLFACLCGFVTKPKGVSFGNKIRIQTGKGASGIYKKNGFLEAQFYQTLTRNQQDAPGACGSSLVPGSQLLYLY